MSKNFRNSDFELEKSLFRPSRQENSDNKIMNTFIDHYIWRMPLQISLNIRKSFSTEIQAVSIAVQQTFEDEDKKASPIIWIISFRKEIAGLIGCIFSA